MVGLRLVFSVILTVSAGSAYAAEVSEKLRLSVQAIASELEGARGKAATDLVRVFNSSPLPTERANAALQLGAYYATRNERLALQFLNYAKSNLTDADARDELDFYLAQTLFRSEAHVPTIVLAKAMLARKLRWEVRAAVYEMLLLAAYRAEDYGTFAEHFAVYEKEIPRARLSEEVLACAARLVQGGIDTDAYVNLLESLAANHPLTEISTKAFKKLLARSVPNESGKASYIFSYDLISRLFPNRALEEELDKTLLKLLDGPIRVGPGIPVTLAPLEKLEVFQRLRAWPEARQLATEQLGNKDLATGPRQRVLRALAISLAKLGEHEEAGTYYERFFKEREAAEESEAMNDREAYARIQSLNGNFKGAAVIYAQLAKQTNKGVYRWMHFWNTYLAGDNDGALRLLNAGTYVTPLDTDEPVADYWRARILERMGRTGQAQKLRNALAEGHPGSFYSLLVVSRYGAPQGASLQRDPTGIELATIQGDQGTSTDTNLLSLRHSEHPMKQSFPLIYDRFLGPLADTVGIDKHIVLSLMRAESQFNPGARSTVGAVGLMQIMPATAYQISRLLDDPHFDIYRLSDPLTNIAYGTFYFSHLVNYYSGNYILAIAAYNAGPNAVNQWLKACGSCELDEFVESIPYRETRRYVKKVMRFYGQYVRLYRDELDVPLLKDELPASLPADYPVF